MRLLGRYLTGLAAALGALSAIAFAQAPAAPPQAPPQQPMTFFITSTPKGDGANYGGLAGADAHCQQLAAAVRRPGVPT